MKVLPQAYTRDIVVQNLGKEVLIYNLNTYKAFNLNETSAIVYRACDGKTSFDELKRQHKFTDDLIYLALDELQNHNLIEADSFNSPFAGMNRREVIRKVGLSSLIALPVISALIAPTAANAASSGCPVGSPNPGGAPAGTPVTAQTTNQSDVTRENQDFNGQAVAAQCCSNSYDTNSFQTNGCSSGAGEVCKGQATCN